MARLATEKLTLRAGDKCLARDLDLAIDAGQNWAILGANGSGKTTLLLTLAGLRPPRSGGVLLDGRPIAAVPRRERARAVGLLFQDSAGAFPATVLETVLSGRHPHLGRLDTEGPADHAIAAAALEAVGLSTLAGRTLGTLSGGERRRVEIAAVLAQQAPLCLWDEPINHLDPQHQVSLLRLLSGRVQQTGHANLFVLHDINLALRYCSHGLLLLPDGRHRHGLLDAIITAPALEAAYGCAMREVRAGERRLFIPAD
jgi:iron complex transport system ATP-binding protein